MPRHFSRLAAALAAVTVLAAGCATSIQGRPAVDRSAASALAAAESTTSPPTSTSGTPTGTPDTPSSTPDAPSTSLTETAPTSTSQIRPMPPVTGSGADADTGTTATTPTSRHTGATGQASGGTVHGVPVDAIADKLRDDPVVIDNDARAAADPDALADLDDQVTAARASGLNIWVVLIGHEISELTDVSDAIARKAGGTVVVVTTTHFAVSSNEFDQSQLNKAEDAAGSASTSVDAAAILVDRFLAMSATAQQTGSGSSGDAGPSLPSFQLADHSIGCMIIDGSVRCDLIVKHTYTPPKNPHPDCQGDYGSSIMMPPGKAPAFVCVSDTAYDPKAPVLADGGDTVVGHVMCFANGPEVSCFDLDSAHGFALSAGSFELF